MKAHCKILMLVAVCAAFAAYAGAGDYELNWYVLPGGGGMSSGGDFQLHGTIGQSVVGVKTGGEFVLEGGFWGGSAVTTPSCPGDITGNGSVGVPDLLQLLACWGPMQPGCAAADLTGSNSVGVPDLLQLLANWGPCP